MVFNASRDIYPPPKVILNVSGDCFDYVRVYSRGFWNVPSGETILQFLFFRFCIIIFLYVSLASFFHIFLRRLNLPRLCSQMLAGFVLGPSGVELYFPDVASYLFNTNYMPGGFAWPNNLVVSIAKLGYMLFVFMVGVRMDPSLMWKQGRVPPMLGVLLALLPVAMIMTLDVKVVKNNPFEGVNGSLKRLQFTTAFFMVINYSQFVSVSTILMQLKISNSKIGHIALATQLTTEFVAFLFYIFKRYKDMWVQVKPFTAIEAMFLCTIFVLGIIFVVRPLIFNFIRKTPEDQPPRKLYTNIIVLLALLCCILGHLFGLTTTNGPFFLGLLIPAGSPFARDIINKLETIVAGLFIPLMITFGASKFSILWFLYELPLSFTMSLIGFALKLLFTFLIILCFKFSPRESLALALILNNKGVVEAGAFMDGNIEYKDVTATSGFFMVFILAAIIAPLVKVLYNPAKQYVGYNKKCLQYASADAELSILACAHRQEEALAVIRLLEFSNATKESPLAVHGLCLEELVASSTPLLVDHQLGQITNPSFGSRSQPIIDIFKYFQSQHKKLTRVHIFTAISPMKQMHEDICWLGFDKAASLIIVPFHRKWNNKTKKLMPGHTDARNMNIELLNRAPCSLAILVDRRGTQGLSSVFITLSTYRVGTLFIGGDDDRESLAYALRMAGCTRVELTVVRLTSDSEHGQDLWESMLDTEALRNLKDEMKRSGNINYREEKVRDGADTAAIVKEMAGNFDLMIVGRRHENEPRAISGLSEWIELPELGLIGDILASPDISHAVSVLVVQQQIMKASHSSVLNS